MYTILGHLKKNEFLEFFKCMLTNKIKIPSLDAGDIGALVGFKDIKTGDTFVMKKAHNFRINGLSRTSNWFGN